MSAVKKGSQSPDDHVSDDQAATVAFRSGSTMPPSVLGRQANQHFNLLGSSVRSIYDGRNAGGLALHTFGKELLDPSLDVVTDQTHAFDATLGGFVSFPDFDAGSLR
jgi:hypothetical protein